MSGGKEVRKLRFKNAQVRWWVYAILAIAAFLIVLLFLVGPGADWLANIKLFPGRP